MHFALTNKVYNKDSNYKEAVLYYADTFINPPEGRLEIPSEFTNNGNKYKVVRILSEAFRHTNLKEIIFPETIEQYPKRIFSSAKQLEKIEFKSQIDDLSELFSGLFFYEKGYSKLKEVIFHYQFKIVPRYGFNLYNFKKFTILNKDEDGINYRIINDSMIIDRNNNILLANQTQNNRYTLYYGILGIAPYVYANRVIEDIKFSNTIRDIYIYAFKDSILPKKVVLPDSVKNIYDEAFDVKSKTEFIIPEGIEGIGQNVFSAGSVVKFRGPKPQWFEENTQPEGVTFIYNYKGD